MPAARLRSDSPASIVAVFTAALFLAFAPCARAEATVQLLTGEMAGARFTIARPENWSRNLLIYAHGYRAPESPVTAELDTKDPAFARLLSEGWMIAMTSYRRNGMIVRDAIADLNALRDHVEKKLGAPSLVVLLGESMGGAIVTLMAENEPDRFHGALAIGAALQVRDDVYPLALTHAPKVPILFLTNQSELAGPAAYAESAAKAPVPPALWSVARDGHVNVNGDERTLALEGLIAWITTNRIERRRDATVEIAATPSQVTFADGAGRGAVKEVTDNYGNLFTTFQPADFAKLGIAKGESFELSAGGKTYRVLYGANYDDVPRGEWVAFPRAEGVILVSRNFGDAAATAGVKAGDPLVVRPVKRK